MQLAFADADLQRLYTDETFHLARVGPEITAAYRKKIGLLAAATNEVELRNFRSLNLEKLKHDRAGQYSIRLNQQWRLIISFSTGEDGRAVLIIEIVDYH